jgi:hypothetical protein
MRHFKPVPGPGPEFEGDAAYRTFGKGGALYRMVSVNNNRAIIYVFDAEVEAYYSLEKAKTDPLYQFEKDSEAVN